MSRELTIRESQKVIKTDRPDTINLWFSGKDLVIEVQQNNIGDTGDPADRYACITLTPTQVREMVEWLKP